MNTIIKEKIQSSENFNQLKDLNKFLYILSIFYSKSHMLDYYSEGIPVNNLKLRKLIAVNRAESYLQSLILLDIIEITKRHSKGSSSTKYMLKEPWSQLPFQRHKVFADIGGKSWITKLIKERYDFNGEQAITRIEKYQLKILNQIQISTAGLAMLNRKYFAKKLYDILPEDFILMSIFYKDYYSFRNPPNNGRLYTNIVNLKS